MLGSHFLPFRSYHGRRLLLCILLCGLRCHQCCYSCFITDGERQSLCHYTLISGKMESQEECEDAIREGFKPLDNSFIPSSAFSKVQRYLESFHREVRLIDVLLPPKIWRDQFNKKMAEYVRGVQSIASSEPHEACRPPCGLQKEALNYNCSQCKDLNCDLPVACELEDIHVKEGQPTDLFCYVNFTLPTVFSITWMFAYNFRITDLSFFQKISHIHSSLMYIKIFFTGDDDSHLEIKYTRPRHRGTYLCQIEDFVDDILVQKFFFVNVSHKDHTAALRWMENFPKMVAARNRTWPRRRVKLRLSWSEFNLKEYLDDQEPLSIGALVLATIGSALLFTLFILMCRALCFYLTNKDVTSLRESEHLMKLYADEMCAQDSHRPSRK